jgi:glycosyltransferase involved in cell wall biosynthesis/predicted O-methyltransferase YrrM
MQKKADLNGRPRLTIWTDCPALGGIGEFSHSMAMGMQACGYDVSVVVPELDWRRHERERTAGICHHEVRLPERQIRGPLVLAKEDTLNLLYAIKPDVILFADGSAISNLLVKECALELNIPMVFSIGIVLEQHIPVALQSPNFQKLNEAAQSVVTVCRHNAELLARHYPIGTARLKIIRYGRPDIFFEPIDVGRWNARRSEIGVKPDELLFMTAARYDSIKGYDLVVEALHRLKTNEADVWNRAHFAWAGEGPMDGVLRKAVADLGLNDRVHILGPCRDINDWLGASDAFLLPSRAEGMPLSIMEAMAKGVPVIATRVSGIPEELGNLGLLVEDPNKNPMRAIREIRRAISWIVKNPEKRQELGRQIRQRADMLFHESRMVTDYARLIGSACPNVQPAMRPHDYVTPGYETVYPDIAFPHMVAGNTGDCDWPHLRRGIMHNWYVDRRVPTVGFLSRDEAHILYNAALPFVGKPALEIGCFMGWSTCHLALAGVHLDVVDPLLNEPQFYDSVDSSLRAAGVRDRVNLIKGRSPEAVQTLGASGQRWSVFFIDGDHEGDAPHADAATAEAFAADDCLVLFHDLAAPAVANGLRYFKSRGWKTRVYRTMQVMGVAWRGKATPPKHVPDPAISSSLPLKLADLVGDETFQRIQVRCAPFTMTSVQRQYFLHQALQHVVEHHIEGDIVECGVWRGGSMMLAALTLAALGESDRHLILFDTFCGMTAPGDNDIEVQSGRLAERVLALNRRDESNNYWAIAPLDTVKKNMEATEYPSDCVEYVVGDICQTLPAKKTRPIALLRLDTDWYKSTRCELEYLFDQLQHGGILIIDDYGFWQGARRACDEFFAGRLEKLYPIPDDDTGHFAIKGMTEISNDFARRLLV